MKTHNLRAVPSVGDEARHEQRGGELIDLARRFLTRSNRRAEASALRGAARGLLSAPHKVVTAGEVGHKLMDLANEIERNDD